MTEDGVMAILGLSVILGVIVLLVRPRRSSRLPAARAAATGRDVFDAATSHPVPSPKILTGRAYVVDGDTVIIGRTSIRLFGIDAPEMQHPYGRKAKSTLLALCKGQRVEAEVVAEDAHGRTVACCRLPDGRDLSAEMVKRGMALDWARFSGGHYRPLETEDARRKLWLADARQKGRMHVWARYEDRQKQRAEQA
jgi:endonuclease YncB( thermonuclease family)